MILNYFHFHCMYGIIHSVSKAFSFRRQVKLKYEGWNFNSGNY